MPVKDLLLTKQLTRRPYGPFHSRLVPERPAVAWQSVTTRERAGCDGDS